MTGEEWNRRVTERTTVEDLGDPPTTAHWLAWATAVLLIIGVVSAVVMNVAGGGSDDGLVTAAAQPEVTLDVTSTTSPPAPPSTARQPAASSTTVPKAAAAVLKALGTTAPPTTRPPATTSTTAPPVTTTTPSTTTSTTLPPRATVSVVNELSRDFVIILNKGEPFTVAANRSSAAVQLNLVTRDDTIEGDAVGEPPCEVGAIGDLFQSGGRYRVAIVAAEDACARLTVTPII